MKVRTHYLRCHRHGEQQQAKNSYGFLILYKGRIVTENYWNNWNANTKYPIASAGKSITAFLVGLAQQENLLSVSDPTSKYLGRWTNIPIKKENLITLHNQLTMTTGLNEETDHCLEKSCLTYKTNPDVRWAYHNAPYNLLHKVIEITSGTSMNEYTRIRLASKIGLRNWEWDNYQLSLSTRDMARFGLLILSKGTWNDEVIMSDSTYFNSMLSTSNGKNKSYGYLWWLNGKDSYMVPADENTFTGSLTSTAPNDMVAAMGKGDKKIYVVPSLDLVVVRHGDDTGDSVFGPSSFDAELWRRLKGVINF